MHKKNLTITTIILGLVILIGMTMFVVEKKKEAKEQERQRMVEVKKEEEKKIAEQKTKEEKEVDENKMRNEVDQATEDEKRKNSGSIEKLANGWQKYRNEEYGFELEYPSNWKFRLMEDLEYNNGIECYFFEKDLNSYQHVMICPNGGFSYGVEKPKVVYDKFKGKDAKMFWYNDKNIPNYVYILNNKPEKWNDENILEFVGDDMNLEKIYDSFGFIE